MDIPSNFNLTTPRQDFPRVILSLEERRECEDCGELKLTTELRAGLWWKCESCWENFIETYSQKWGWRGDV